MTILNITRGNVVFWTVTFLDADDNELSPDSAALVVSYLDSSGNRVSTDMIVMVSDSGATVWLAEWNSGVANHGSVYWSAQSEGPAAAEDGVFMLTANLANLEF